MLVSRVVRPEQQVICPRTACDDPVEAAKKNQYIKSCPRAGQIVELLRALDLKDDAAAIPDSATDELKRKIGFALWSADMVVSMNLKGFTITKTRLFYKKIIMTETPVTCTLSRERYCPVPYQMANINEINTFNDESHLDSLKSGW